MQADPSHDTPERRQETADALAAIKHGDGTPLSLKIVCRMLDLQDNQIGLVADILRGRWEHVSTERHEDVRRRLGLPFYSQHVIAVSNDQDALAYLQSGTGRLQVYPLSKGQIVRVVDGEAVETLEVSAELMAALRPVKVGKPKKRKKYRTLRLDPDRYTMTGDEARAWLDVKQAFINFAKSTERTVEALIEMSKGFGGDPQNSAPGLTAAAILLDGDDWPEVWQEIAATILSTDTPTPQEEQ